MMIARAYQFIFFKLDVVPIIRKAKKYKMANGSWEDCKALCLTHSCTTWSFKVSKLSDQAKLEKFIILTYSIKGPQEGKKEGLFPAKC